MALSLWAEAQIVKPDHAIGFRPNPHLARVLETAVEKPPALDRVVDRHVVFVGVGKCDDGWPLTA